MSDSWRILSRTQIGTEINVGRCRRIMFQSQNDGCGAKLYDSGIRRSAMAANQLQPTGMISSLNS